MQRKRAAAHSMVLCGGGRNAQIAGCCNPDKPAMCTGAAQKASMVQRAATPNGDETPAVVVEVPAVQVVNNRTPSDGAAPTSAAFGLCGAALAAAFL